MNVGLWLIKRGPKPDYQRAPFHPVILCTRLHTAKWEAGDTGEGAWIWVKGELQEPHSGWLLVRWNGFDIDYGSVVHGILMPDGWDAGIDHDRNKEPWTLLNGAIWWSEHHMPLWIKDSGVKMPEDEFTIRRIFNDCHIGIWNHGKEEKFLQARERQLKAGKLIDWEKVLIG